MNTKELKDLIARRCRDDDTKERREIRAEIHTAMSAMIDAAEAGNRELTAEENSLFGRLRNKADLLSSEIVALDAADQQAAREGGYVIGGPLRHPDGIVGGELGPGRSAPPASWADSAGRPVYCLSPTQKMADLPSAHGDRFADIPHAFGQSLISAATGNWRRLPGEIRAAMSETSNAGGGYLVPEELSRRVIDLARAKSVLIRAGAFTLAMTSDRATLARVTADPTIEVHAENASFTEREITLDSVGLTAYTIGCVVSASRELIDDSLNGARLIEGVLVNALAAELDRQMLRGSGSQEMLGILNKSGIGTTGSVGAIAWADLLTALEGIETANHTASAYVVNPAIAKDLNALTSGDGTNSAANWQGPPPGVDTLQRFVTSNMPTSDVLVGDFSQAILGLRQDALVELTNTGGNAFEKHQTLIKVTWRGDIGVEHADAFYDLAGVTT